MYARSSPEIQRERSEKPPSETMRKSSSPSSSSTAHAPSTPGNGSLASTGNGAFPAIWAAIDATRSGGTENRSTGTYGQPAFMQARKHATMSGCLLP